MPHLDAIETGATSGSRRSRRPPSPDAPRSPARRPRAQSRWRPDRELLLRHERASGAEISRECVAEIVHDAAGNQRARNVRPADRAAVRLLEHFVHRQRDTEPIELSTIFSARTCRATRRSASRVSSGPELGEMEREQMNFMVIVKALSSTPAITRMPSRSPLRAQDHPVHRIVIRER